MKPFFAAIALIGLSAASAAAQDYSRLAGGPDARASYQDRPEYSGSPIGPVTGSAPGPQVIEIWDGTQWRSHDYCRARGGCSSPTPPPDYQPRHEVNYRTDIQIPSGAPRRFSECPEGTRRETPQTGGDPICIVVHSGGGYRAAEYREPQPRHVEPPTYRIEQPRYVEPPRYIEPPRYVEHRPEPPRYTPPCVRQQVETYYEASPCGSHRETYYAETSTYREHRSYNREWYGQDGRYWRVVDVRGHGGDACPCSRRDYGYSSCDHRHESDYRHREEAYGYYQDGYYSDDLAWNYAGVRSPVYYGGGGGGAPRVFGSLNLPSAGARAYGGANAGAGASASTSVNTSTRVNVNVGVRGSYGGGGGHGGYGGRGGGHGGGGYGGRGGGHGGGGYGGGGGGNSGGY